MVRVPLVFALLVGLSLRLGRLYLEVCLGCCSLLLDRLLVKILVYYINLGELLWHLFYGNCLVLPLECGGKCLSRMEFRNRLHVADLIKGWFLG